jgi:hypothetical protein
VARSLLEQLTQIRRSRTYDDAVANVNTSAVAEPTSVSGSLQEDLNIIRTLMKDLKGGTNWYDSLGNYFDPTTTDSGSATTKALTLSNISGNTLDSKTVIVPVTADNTGSNYTVSGTSTGFLLTTSAQYATPTDREGLPIFASTANTGSYWDEAGADNVCRIDVLDADTDAEFQNNAGETIYAKFHDSDDFSGGGDGVDAYVRFYANDVACDLSTISGTTPTSIYVIYPRRKVMSSMEEYDWLRTDFVNSWEGDVELIEDIQNLWSFTGAADNVTDPTWTNEAASYILTSSPDDLETAVDLLNTEVGDRIYTSATYLTDGETITESLDSLSEGVISNDSDISTNAGDISTNAGAITTLEGSMTTAQTDITNLEAATGTSTGLAGIDYSSNNYVTDGTSLEAAIGALDAAIGLSAAAKYIETSGAITKNTVHSLPSAAISDGGYTPDSTAGQEGKNMDVYVSGQLVAADTGAAGVNADRDYGETTTSGVTFRFDIPAGSNLIYVIRQ